MSAPNSLCSDSRLYALALSNLVMSNLVGRAATAETVVPSSNAILKSRGGAKNAAYAKFISAPAIAGKIALEEDYDDEEEVLLARAPGRKPIEAAPVDVAPVKPAVAAEVLRKQAVEVRRAWLEEQETLAEMRDLGSELPAPKPAPKPAPPPTAGNKGRTSAETDFIAAATFGGPKPGFSFKRGDKGTGYYADAAAGNHQGGSSGSSGGDDKDDPLRAAMASSRAPALSAGLNSAAAAEAAWADAPVFGGGGEAGAVDISEVEAAAPPPVALPAASPVVPPSGSQLPVEPPRPAQPPQPSPPQPLLAVARSNGDSKLASGGASGAASGGATAVSGAASAAASDDAAGMAASVVEFGSMTVADEESSEEDEESDEGQAESASPPGGGRAAAWKSRYRGGDDSDGEIEYG